LAQEQATAAGFEDVYALTELETNVTTCMAEAGTLLEQVGIHIREQLAAKKLSRSPISKEDLHV
jgi:glycerate kinase